MRSVSTLARYGMLAPVPTSLSARVEFPADPVRTYLLVTDKGYVRAVAEATAGQDVEVSVEPTPDGGAVVTSRRTLPAELPSYARALVGDRLRLVESRAYGPAAADGSRTGTVEVRFEGAPVRIDGTLALRAEGEGSVIDMTAAVAASVPFVGGKVERFAAEQVRAFLRKETEVAVARLP